MRTLQLNHVAIHVTDVPRSVAFYRDVLRLAEIPRPAFSFPGAWFRLGHDQELHLIGDSQYPVVDQHRGNHYALLIDDVEEWQRHLAGVGASHLPRHSRLAKQEAPRSLFSAVPLGRGGVSIAVNSQVTRIACR